MMSICYIVHSTWQSNQFLQHLPKSGGSGDIKSIMQKLEEIFKILAMPVMEKLICLKLILTGDTKQKLKIIRLYCKQSVKLQNS